MRNKCINLKREKVEIRFANRKKYIGLPYWFWSSMYVDERTDTFYSYASDDKKIVQFFLKKFQYLEEREKVELISMKKKSRHSKQYVIVFCEDGELYKSDFELIRVTDEK